MECRGTIRVLSIALMFALTDPATRALAATENLDATNLNKLEDEVRTLRRENAELRKRLRQQEQARGLASVGTGPSRDRTIYPAPLPSGRFMAATDPAVAMAHRVVTPLARTDWTGPYAGFNLGLGVGRNLTDLTNVITPGNNTNTITFPEAAERANLSPIGLIGGVQAGYNWQLRPNWVAGIEADIQGTTLRDPSNCLIVCSPGRSGSLTQKLPWFGTARLRAGWTNGPAMIYATGGLAVGEVVTDVTFRGNSTDTTSASAAERFKSVKAGWAAGGGIEAQLMGNWMGRIEYLYVDLGSVSGTARLSGDDTFYNDTEVRFSSSVHQHVVRGGVSYKFGAPVYTDGAVAAPSAGDWSGSYAGLNVGGGIARNPTDHTIAVLSRNTEQFVSSPFGVVGGLQIGHNWQAGPNWIWGVEVDAQGSGQDESENCIAGCISLFNFFGVTKMAQKMPWFGTVRGRAGWTSGRELYYATGGLAYGRITTDLHTTLRITPNPAVSTGSFTQDKVGWTAGAGIETRLAGDWSAKIEYLYMNLGTVSGSVPILIPSGAAIGSTSFSSDVESHVVRLGVNHQFH